MGIQNNTPRTTTIFSINPSTGKAYMELTEIEGRTRGYLCRHAKNLLSRMDLDDVQQEVYLSLIATEYNPQAYEASIWLYINIKSTIGEQHKTLQAKKNNFTIPDSVKTNSDGESFSLLDMATDHISPEDIILANEVFNKFRYDNIRNAIVWGDDLKLAPNEYKGPTIILFKKNRVVEDYQSLI